MKNVLQARNRLALLLIAALGVSPVFADKPSKGDGGKHPHKEKAQKEQYERRDDHGKGYDDRDSGGRYEERSFHGGRESDFRHEPYFNDQHRSTMRDYYTQQYRSGHCPPGLEKKHNGCMPPGQAKKWQIGQPLPRDVIFYDVPAGMIGYPPPGYRFVRVASDILMIAIGTGMVVDAITDLSGW